MNAAIQIKNANSSKIIDVSSRLKKKRTSTKKTKKIRIAARVSDEQVKQHSASWLREEDINTLLEDLLSDHKYFKANIIVFACNVGFRYGDIMPLRVMDLINNEGNIKDYLTLEENKTDKWRTVWLNDTVKKMLKYTIEYYGLETDDFIFQSGERKRKYLEDIIMNDKGEEVLVKTSEPYDWNGRPLKVFPMEVDSVSVFLKNITKKHGLEGKFSSHTFRQTFSNYISVIGVDEGLVKDLRIASASLGHSNFKVTKAHYNGVDNRVIKEQALKLNLGKAAVDKYIG